MLPAYLNMRDVDRGVRELVIRLNRLPYAVTVSSCEGHLLPDVDPNVEGFIVWKFTNSRWHPKVGIGIQTDGSYEARQFTGRLRRFCDRYGFVHLIQTEAETEEEINERVKVANFSVYGFKFPLGKEAYAIDIESRKGDKETVIAYKRKVNTLWSELTAEIMQMSSF